MDFVVEDGTGKPDATSYVDLSYANSYLGIFPDTSKWAALSDEQKQNALMRASDLLDHYFIWEGQKTHGEQGLGWPRIGADDCDGTIIGTDVIPDDLKRATCEYAGVVSQSNTISNPVSALGITDIKVDVIELSFDKNVVKYTVPNEIINRLKCLGEYSDAAGSGGIKFAKVIRT